jgi:3-dehydroquinate synthase class II
MVKAYLRYVQQSVLSALVGNLAGIKLLRIAETTYLVSACNEVVSIVNLKTGEVFHQLYDKEAAHG